MRPFTRDEERWTWPSKRPGSTTFPLPSILLSASYLPSTSSALPTSMIFLPLTAMAPSLMMRLSLSMVTSVAPLIMRSI